MVEDNKKMPQAVQVSSYTPRDIRWYSTETYKKFDKAVAMIFEIESLYPVGHDIRTRLYISRGKVVEAKYAAKDRYIKGENMP